MIKSKIKTFLSKSQNIILLLFVIVISFNTIIALIEVVKDSFTIYVESINQLSANQAKSQNTVNYFNFLTSQLTIINLWLPILNTLLLAILTCLISLLYGGTFAYLITRTNIKFKNYLKVCFFIPYILPQWTLAIIWQNMFNSNLVTGTDDGLLVALKGITFPSWWCEGLLPCAIVLGLYFAPFAFILIREGLKSIDASYIEAARILGTPKWKIFTKITLAMIKPAILNIIFFIFGSAICSYLVPFYLNLETLSAKYIFFNSNNISETIVLAIFIMVIGIIILCINLLNIINKEKSMSVIDKARQVPLLNLGNIGKYLIGIVFIVLTFFTSIWPIIIFSIKTFLPNPESFDFLYIDNFADISSRWWITSTINIVLAITICIIYNNIKNSSKVNQSNGENNV